MHACMTPCKVINDTHESRKISVTPTKSIQHFKNVCAEHAKRLENIQQ